MTPQPIGQAVVTAPGGGRACGDVMAASEPATVRCELADPDRWWVPGEDQEPTDRDGGSAAPAQLVATVAPQLAEVYGRLRRQGLSLADDSAGGRARSARPEGLPQPPGVRSGPRPGPPARRRRHPARSPR